jgi:hypothetical protein
MLRIRIRDPALLDRCIWDETNPKSLVKNFWVKNTLNLCQLSVTDPNPGLEKFWIRDKHAGSSTRIQTS